MSWGEDGAPPAPEEDKSTGVLRITARTEPTSVLSMHEMPMSLRRGSRRRLLPRGLTSSPSSASSELSFVLAIDEVEDEGCPFEGRIGESVIICCDNFAVCLLL